MVQSLRRAFATGSVKGFNSKLSSSQPKELEVLPKCDGGGGACSAIGIIIS